MSEHYNKNFGFEFVEISNEILLHPYSWNVLKYLWRLGAKDSKEREIKKIKDYYEMWINLGCPISPPNQKTRLVVEEFSQRILEEGKNPHLSRTIVLLLNQFTSYCEENIEIDYNALLGETNE